METPIHENQPTVSEMTNKDKVKEVKPAKRNIASKYRPLLVINKTKEKQKDGNPTGRKEKITN